MRPGDIYWIDFEPQAGKEIQKRRPALVISGESLNKKTNQPVVLPITNKGYSNREAGLTVDLEGACKTTRSVVLCCVPKALDFEARKAEFVESIPIDMLNEILLKTVTLLFPSLIHRAR